MAVSVRKARDYVYGSGVLMERALFSYLLEDGPLEHLHRCLLAYNNPDGGRLGQAPPPTLAVTAPMVTSGITGYTVYRWVGSQVTSDQTTDGRSVTTYLRDPVTGLGIAAVTVDRTPVDAAGMRRITRTTALRQYGEERFADHSALGGAFHRIRRFLQRLLQLLRRGRHLRRRVVIGPRRELLAVEGDHVAPVQLTLRHRVRDLRRGLRVGRRALGGFGGRRRRLGGLGRFGRFGGRRQ